MLIVSGILVLFAALLIEALWRLALAALLSFPVVLCAVAAMQWTVKLHLADPLSPLWGFLAGGLAARAVTTGLTAICHQGRGTARAR